MVRKGGTRGTAVKKGGRFDQGEEKKKRFGKQGLCKMAQKKSDGFRSPGGQGTHWSAGDGNTSKT